MTDAGRGDALVDALVELVAARVARQVGDGRRVYLTTELADYLHCGANRLHKLASQGRVPYRREGDRLLFVRQELDDWLDSGDAGLHRS